MKQIIFFAITLVCFSLVSKAQTPQYTCGNATGSNSIPLGAGTWADQRCQFLYLAGEFGTVPGGMAISKIYFRASTAKSTSSVFTNFRIDIGQSSITTLNASAWITGLTTALSTSSFTVPSTAVDQWIEFTLQTPIPFNPALSLVVDTRQTATSSGFPLRNQTASGLRRAYALSGAAAPTGSGAQRYDLGFDLISLSPCTAPPTPGTFSITPTFVCQGSPITGVLTGNSQGTGQTYQLQSAPTATGTFTNVGSSTTFPAATTNATSTLWYRMAVTCGTSTTYSNAVQVTVNPSLPGGNYTIDPALPASATNFQSFTAAVNAISCGILGPVVFNVASGNYPEQIRIPSLNGTSSVNRVTFKSASGSPSSVVLTYGATSTADNYVVKLDNASYITFKEITMAATGASFCRAIEMVGSASNDSILNCNLTGTAVASTSSNMAIVFADPLTGGDNVFIGNQVNNGSYGFYYNGTSTAVLSDGGVFLNNQLSNQYYYGTYFYYTNNHIFNYNTITTNSIYASWSGYRSYYSDGALELIGNTISGPQGYGVYQYYSDATAAGRGIIKNNVIVIGSGTSTAYGLEIYNCSYQDVHNNSVNINSSSTTGYAGYFYNSVAGTENNKYYNNALKNSGGGYAMYVYNYSANNVYDYNNLYTTGLKLVEAISPAGNYATLTEWRAATGHDRNSVSYDPGYSGTTNLIPDPAKTASWSLNGRGIHIVGNNSDITGATRVVDRAQGVPDIGAYEFTPTSIPPLAIATPTVPAAGTRQTFTFGEDTVAMIEWPALANVPTSVSVTQYTGTIAPQRQAVSPGSYTYFYADIVTPPGDYNFNGNIYYKDPWLGTIASEANMKLIKKVGSNPWIAYNHGLSNTNTNRNIIETTDLNDFGYFTGIDNDILHSAVVKANPKSFCPGGQTTLNANTGPGYTYVWKLNGNIIPNANGSSYNAIAPGNYTVEISNPSSLIATSMPITINVVPPPGALIYPSKATTFCDGDSVTLQANAGGGLRYQWRLNGVDIAGETQSAYVAKAAGTYTVEVRNIGCGSTSNAEIVTIGPPVVNLGPDTSFCELNPLELHAGYPGAKYVWSNGDSMQTTTVTQEGYYWVRVDLGPNCQSVDSIYVDIDLLPKVTGIAAVTSDDGYKLSPSGETDVISYLWIFDNGSIDTSRTIFYKPNSGYRVLKLIVFNNCGADTTNSDVALGVGAQILNTKNFTLYPNPANDKITIKAATDNNFDEITIINGIGSIVYRGPKLSKTSKTEIDISNLPSGSYILRISDKGSNLWNSIFSVVR